MILIIYEDKDLEELISVGKNKKYKTYARNKSFMTKLARTITAITSAKDIDDLKNVSFLKYEKLKFKFSGKSSVRISNEYKERLIFLENENRIEIIMLELNTDHYGND